MRLILAARHVPSRQDVLFLPAHREWRRIAKRFAEEDVALLDQAGIDTLPEDAYLLLPLPKAKTRVLVTRPGAPFPEGLVHRLVLLEDVLELLGEPSETARDCIIACLPRVRELVITQKQESLREAWNEAFQRLAHALRFERDVKRFADELSLHAFRAWPRVLQRKARFKQLRLKDVKHARLVLKAYADFLPEEPSYLIAEADAQPGKTLLLASPVTPDTPPFLISLLTLLIARAQEEKGLHLALILPLAHTPRTPVSLILPSMQRVPLASAWEAHLAMLADAFILGRKYKPRQTLTFLTLPLLGTRMSSMVTESDVAWDAWRASLDETRLEGFRMPLPPVDDPLSLLTLLAREAEGQSWNHLSLPRGSYARSVYEYIHRVGKISLESGKA